MLFATPLPPSSLDNVITSYALDDHKKRISTAAQLPAGPDRDAALLSSLRSISTELVAAEEIHARAAKRVALTKQLFDWAASELSGYSNNDSHEVLRGEDSVDEKKSRAGGENNSIAVVNDDDDDYHQFKLPSSGPIPPIPTAISGGGLSAAQVIAHRDAFYRKLCNVSSSELSSYTPPQSLVNMKSRSQLDQYIYIASHWETGTESMSVMEFRRQHKTFYTKMKLTKENIGRRTGHHLRDIATGTITNTNGNDNNNNSNTMEIGQRKAFCQYGKNDGSLRYLCVEELYDAIFEIYCVANPRGSHHSHRPTLQCKKICNMRYANVPEEQIKVFFETCPICSSSRRSSSSSPTNALKRQKVINSEE
jgi:hypothetical protein